MEPGQAFEIIRAFGTSGLTATIDRIETAARGARADTCADVLAQFQATSDTLVAATTVKNVVGQIHILIHALGILLCLPHILQPDEHVEALSLGAGNSGRDFDLETNLRVAEFKFIRWLKTGNSARNRSLFCDFFGLAEYDTAKRRNIYLLGTTQADAFLSGTTTIASVLDRTSAKIQKQFRELYANRFTTVGEYYRFRAGTVDLEDVSPYLPGFTELDDIT